jgi:hypothetical protein
METRLADFQFEAFQPRLEICVMNRTVETANCKTLVYCGKSKCVVKIGKTFTGVAALAPPYDMREQE